MTTSLETLHALAALQLPGVGQVTARKILAQAGGNSVQQTIAMMLPNLGSKAWDQAIVDSERIIEEGEALGIEAIAITSTRYPARLRQIPDPPVVLYVRGDASVLSRDAIAVVGTRKVSSAGARLTKLVAGYIGKRGFVVVSGVALGVDALAHEAALEVGAITVAVLAHGLDTVSPASNRKLAERILGNGGALVSEHHHGVPARPAEFVRRNRLQSGLSLGSVIVESGAEGGSMHQARFTKAQDRHLMTVLAASDNSRSDLNEAGAHELVSSLGAIAMRSLGDLAKELDGIKVRSETGSIKNELF